MNSWKNDWYQRLQTTADELLTKTVAQWGRGVRSESTISNRNLNLSDLEPRLLFSATPIDPAVLDGADSSATVLQVEVDSSQESGQSASVASTQSSASHLIFVDSNVQDLESLLDDVRTTRPDAEVFVLQSDRDGIEQITEVLDSRSEISSIHLVSHGEDGEIKLGNTWLGESNLNGYAGQIASWQSALTVDADILIYGCDLAASEDGRTLIDSIGALSGADVAASTNDTGHTDFQADWDFEYTVGQIDTQAAFSQQLQESWRYKLASLTIDVDTFSDVVNGGDSVTSLREAIIQANANAGGDTTINLLAGTYTRSLNATGEDNAATGDFDIHENVTIMGAGPTTIDGGYNDRVFEVHSGHLTISELTITAGVVSGDGGGINVDSAGAELTLNRVVLTDNGASQGAAISSVGTITLTDVGISDNGGLGSTVDGGGIFNNGVATLNRVTLSNNAADSGGAIYNEDSSISMSLTNVTISGNQAVSSGGGIYNKNSALTIVNSTITLNTAGSGGGIRSNGSPTPSLLNTIVAGNTGTTANADLQGNYTSSGNNLIGDGTGQSGFTNGTNNDQVGTTGTPIDANLVGLASNGGFVSTHALNDGSLAINAGATAGSATVDARGISRDASRDIGAFETTQSSFWFSTGDDVDSPSGAPGLDSWGHGEAIQLSAPNLQYGNGTTNGTVSSVFDLEALSDDGNVNIDGIHYVTRSITLGTTNTIVLQAGDVLVSTGDNEAFNSGAFTVEDADVFLFRPDAPGNYSSGTFSHVLSGLGSLPDGELNGMDDLWAISLIEQGTVFADTYLEAGDFLFSRQGGAEDNDVYLFRTEDVGNGTTSGVADRLIEGDNIGIGEKIVGLDLAETATTIGGVLVSGGELLVTLDKSDTSIGTSGISVDRQDIFRLQVSQTTLVAGNAVANAAVVLDGSSINLNSAQEDIDALTLVSTDVPQVADVTYAYESFDYTAGSLNGQNGGSGWASAWTLESGSSAQVDSTGLTAPTELERGVGGTLEMNTSGNFEQRRDLATTLGADGTTAWFSFLLKPDGTGVGGISLLIGDGAGTNNTVNVGTSSNDFLLGIDGTISGDTIDNAVIDAQTFFLAVQIDFQAGDDIVTLYVDPTAGVSSPDSSAAMTAQITNADLGSFSRIAFIGGFGGNNSNIDEIRVGNSFQSVAPPRTNLAPTDISVVTQSVDENTDTTSGFSLGLLSALDPDTGETFTWQVVGGADAPHFSIGGAGSNELILTDSVLDYEIQTSYEVTVRVTDGSSNTHDETLTINVNDLNDVTPVIDASQTFSVSEDAANATSLGFVTASDPDTVGALTNWTITGGNTDSIFAINASTGELSITDRTNLDHESNSIYSLSIQVEDGSNSSLIETIAIDVIDVAEVDSLWFSTSLDVTDSQNPDLTQWDEDQVIQLGNPDLSFSPSGSGTDGTLSFAGFKISDFHSTASARIEGMHAVWSDLTVGGTGNDFDLLAGDLLLSLARDGVTLSSATEPDKTFDRNDVFVFRPTTSGDYSAGNFFHLLEDPMGAGRIRGVSLVESSAGVTVGDTHLDQGTFILVRDGTEEQDRVYTYTATSVGDGNTAGSSQILIEGSSTTETTNGGNLGFSERIDGIHIVDSNRTIGGTNLVAGDLLLTTYNASSIVALPVTDQDITLLRMTTTRIGDDHSTGTAQLLVNADELGMDPGDTAEDIDSLTLVEGANFNAAIGVISDTDVTTNAVAENASTGTTVGVTANASDVGDTVTYTLDDNAGDRFQIHGSTGVVTVLNPSDFESAQSHEIIVRATSSDTSTRVLSFTIQITDVNEVPSVSLSTNAANITENADTTSATTLATITVNDDALGSESLQLSGTDAGLFEIVSGELRLRSGVSLDFETKPSIQVTVEVDDNTVGGTPDDTQTFTLTIQDQNEVAVGIPQVQGTTTEGETLTADTSGISDENGLGTFQYQWFRSGAVITGANSNSYVLTTLDVNETIRVAVQFTDGQANTEGPLMSNATGTISPTNQSPTLDNYETTTTTGTAKTIPRLVFNSLSNDPDGDPLTAVLVTPPPEGTLDLQPNGRFTYTPDAGFVGRVVFEWQATDGSLTSAPATVTIDVVRGSIPITLPPSNRAPITPTTPGGDSQGSETDSGDESQDDSETTDSAEEKNSDSNDSPGSPPSNRESQKESPESTTATPTAVAPVVANAESSGDQSAQASPADAALESASESSSNRSGRTTQSSQASGGSDSSDVTRLGDRGDNLHWKDMVMLTRPGAMWDELDNSRQQVETQIQGDLIVVGSAGAAASSFTVGAVAWAMRSGFLVSGLIAHMPAWSGVDPLMIMQSMSGAGMTDNQETLEELMDRQSKAMESDGEES